MFADFAQPSTIAFLLIDVALLALAGVAGFRGVLLRPALWIARGLAAITLVLGLAFIVGMVLELWTATLPFVLGDAPLGTYARMTQLGLLLSVFTWALIAIGSAFAFRRPGVGGTLLVVVSLVGLLDELRKGLQDPTLPLPSLTFGVLLMLLVLVAGVLVLATRHATPSGPGRARRSVAHRRLDAEGALFRGR